MNTYVIVTHDSESHGQKPVYVTHKLKIYLCIKISLKLEIKEKFYEPNQFILSRNSLVVLKLSTNKT